MKSYYQRRRARRVYIGLIIVGVLGTFGGSLMCCFRSLDFLMPFTITLMLTSIVTALSCIFAFALSDLD